MIMVVKIIQPQRVFIMTMVKCKHMAKKDMPSNNDTCIYNYLIIGSFIYTGSVVAAMMSFDENNHNAILESLAILHLM